MPKIARISLSVLVLMALSGGLWVYLHRSPPDNPNHLTLYGNVDIREVQPAFNDSGHITRLLVQEGDTVKQGQLLAVIDDSRYAAALARAKATKQAARITYRNDETNYKRYSALAARSATSIQQRDDARAAYEAARANYKAADAAVALARREYDDTRLYAPAAGVVENRIMEPGDMASPSTPVYTIALPSPKWVRAYVPERDLGRIRQGMSAEISTDSYPDRRYHGWIGYISPTAEFTPKTVETPELRTALVYQIRIYVCDDQLQLRLGMPATVRINLTPAATAQQSGCGPNHAAGQ